MKRFLSVLLLIPSIAFADPVSTIPADLPTNAQMTAATNAAATAQTAAAQAQTAATQASTDAATAKTNAASAQTSATTAQTAATTAQGMATTAINNGKVAVLGYQNAAPVSAATVAMSDGVGILRITSGLLATLTVKLPPTPVDGQVARIWSVGGVTLMTVQSGTGAAVASGLVLSASGVAMLFQYQSTAWVRIG